MDDQAVLQAIAQAYLTSGDFNGYPVPSLRREFGLTTSEAKEAVRRLLRERKIDVIFGNVHPNPHIKAFSHISNEDQRKFLDEFEFTDHICLYPSREVLATLPDVDRFKDSPFTHELALGAGQLDYRVFDLSVLEYYRNDPRYYYETDFVNGSISIHDEHFESGTMADHDQVLLQTFGFAYDDQLNRAVAVFLRYLSKLSPEHQRIWQTKKLSGVYKLHPDYYRNTILGDWGTRISIFEAFTQELKIINAMATLMERPQLFRESFAEERPKEFGFLLRPTLAEFNAFVLLLDKMMSDNINKEFFANEIPLEEDEERPDGKIVVRQKGMIALLEAWVRKYFRPANRKPMDHMFKGFRAVRKLRQKPATP
ncbi:MAG: AAA family ATPase [Deltaproteobacteria bacterium]|nr:AAA family ATPase [Deltaproteobacteria bacterium]